jgi:uncharacterized repeat protein (TIGR03803 family)
MKRSEQTRNGIGGLDLWLTVVATVIAALLIVAATPAPAQTLTVLHNFTGGLDGKIPYTGLTMDRAGNLYGTTAYGGFTGNDCAQAGNVGGCGTIFRLAREGSGWAFNPLYQFQGYPSGDGAQPFGRVILGPDGNLYGTTFYGGVTSPHCLAGEFEIGCGTVFKLSPPPTPCKTVLCGWEETQLYSFAGAPDGSNPRGEIVFDAAGNLYGATESGGTNDSGTIFELTALSGMWTETTLYSLSHLSGSAPIGGVAIDPAGTFYGTTDSGGQGDFGTVFQLASSGSNWTLNVLHTFGLGNDGLGTYAGVVLDQSGNLYGGTVNGTPNGDAVVFEMGPSSGGWTYNIIYTFVQSYGGGPAANLVMDAAGNLYGTTRGLGETGNPWGNVFKLTPSNGEWIYTDLHDFTGGSDGGVPYSSLVLDSNGNLYGTTTAGGQYGVGVVFEITP